MKYLIGLMLIAFSNVSLAFDYPLGIPDAWIDPDIPVPSRPVDWSEEVAGYYYVDQTSELCDDDQSYGSEAIPRCRLISSPFPAGSYIELHGLFDYTSKVYAWAAGTADRPVWLVGADDNDVQLGLTLSGTHFYVDGINMSGAKMGMSIRPYKDRQTDHIMIRNTSMVGTGQLGGGSGISAGGDVAHNMVNVMAYNNRISYAGQWDATTENDRHALQTGSYITNVWFLNNITHHNGGDGVQFSHGGVRSNHFYYGGNTSYSERENCVDIKQADDVVVSSNTCYDIQKVSSAQGECMVVHYNPSRIWFLNNDISDCEYGVISTGAFDVHVIGNNIHNIHETALESHGDISSYQTGAAIAAYSTGDMTVANNTITNAVRGFSYEALAGFQVNVTGNIIKDLHAGVYSGNSPYSIMIKGNNATSDNALVESNIFHSPFRAYMDGVTSLSVKSLVKDNYCLSGKCSSSDPLLADNYTLSEGSVAIDNGQVTDSYAKFFSYYGLDIESDLKYIKRDVLPDVGAFESNGVPVPRQPLAASGVYVDVIGEKLVWVNETPDISKIAVYKNGALLSDSLALDATTLKVQGISGEISEYTIKVSNAQGVVEGDSITTDIVSVTAIADNLYEGLIDTSSYYIPRVSLISGAGSINIEAPKPTIPVYGSSYSKSKFTIDGDEVARGYIYVVGVDGNSIGGKLSGLGTVDVLTVDNNYSNAQTKADFIINDSVVKVVNDKGFQQNRISIVIDGELSYKYVPTTDDPKSAIGISGIVEQ